MKRLGWVNFQILAFTLCSLMVVNISCTKEKKQSGGAEEAPTYEPDPTPRNRDTDATAAKTRQQCNSAGKAWIPVVNSGESPATCAGPLKSWNCCKEQVYGRFPNLLKELQTKIDGWEGKGYELYNCEDAGNKKTILHFYKEEGLRTLYSHVDITAFETEPTKQPICANTRSKNSFSADKSPDDLPPEDDAAHPEEEHHDQDSSEQDSHGH